MIGGGAGKRHVAVFETARPHEIPAGNRIRVTLQQNFVHQQTLGPFRRFVTGNDGPLHADLRPTLIDLLLRKAAESRTAEQRQTLRDYFLSVSPELGPYNDEIQKLRESCPRFPTTFVFEERPHQNKRPTHVRPRGAY